MPYCHNNHQKTTINSKTLWHKQSIIVFSNNAIHIHIYNYQTNYNYEL